MKKFVMFFVLLAPIGLRAQTFEGTIRWSMTMEITDPAAKAQMAQAQQQLNDPETQAKMKEMEAKMNDPEMKKMMEQNPQMKAAMEAAMKSAKGGGAPGGGMMPTGMTLKVKGSNSVTLMEGGMTNGMEILHVSGKPSVRINRAEKTYSTLPEGQPGSNPNQPQVNVTKTTETTKILGYTCTKYLVEMTDRGQTMKQTMWATTEIKDMDMKALARQRNAQGQPMFSDKIEGIPLKIEATMPQGNMVMEVKEINREKISDAEFTIPAGFKEVKMNGF